MSERKDKAFELATAHVCPGKVETFRGVGVDLVIGKREGPYLYDLDGRQLIDCHINGGTFNLGHRNPDIITTLEESLKTLDIGNHHFASEARNSLATKLLASAPGEMQYVVFASGGSEAVDVAIKTARYATQRRTIISIDSGYHGRTGLSGAVGDNDAAKFFLSAGPDDEFIRVPFNDLDAMRAALSTNEAAAVIIETMPATMGFPLPAEGYLPSVKALCEEHGALYIADEVQTGLGRTGNLWAIEGYGLAPDIMVTGKGLSGGIYPMAATLMTATCGAWLSENGFGHVSTFGGAEVGCPVAEKVLDICGDEETLANVREMSAYLIEGLEKVRAKFPDHILEIRANGLVMGLKFTGDMGGVLMAKCLYENGIWAMFAGYDMSVLQFKPILLIDKPLADETLARFEKGMAAFAEMMS